MHYTHPPFSRKHYTVMRARGSFEFLENILEKGLEKDVAAWTQDPNSPEFAKNIMVKWARTPIFLRMLNK